MQEVKVKGPDVRLEIGAGRGGREKRPHDS